MKHFFLLTICSLMFVARAYSQIQVLSPEMKAYYDYCLDIRGGVENKDAARLEKCIDVWEETLDGSKLKYNDCEFTITPTFDFKRVDGSEEPSLKGHLMFIPEYVDSLLAHDIDINRTPVYEPEQMKGGLEGSFCYEHVLLPANSKVSYKNSAANETELFAVTECGGMVNLSVVVDADGKKYEQTSDTGFVAPILKWTMAFGSYTLTLENKTNKDISVVIVTN